MDQILAVLASFPPNSDEIDTTKKYDAAIKGHLTAVSKVLSSLPAGTWADLGGVLEARGLAVDPSVNTVGFLVVLDSISSQAEPNPSFSRISFLDKILEFLMTFDTRQIRYVGRQLLALIDVVASGKLFSFPVAAEAIASVILRIDPTGSVCTSTHVILAKLAVEKGLPDAALRVIDKDVTLYPNMGGAKNTKPLCDPDLVPSVYISSATSLSHSLKSVSVMEYHLLCGFVYIMKRNWAKAQKSFERVLVHPTKDKGVSTFMVESYKKWLLIGLLSEGRAPSLPAYTPAATKMSCTALASAYQNIATLFSTDNAAEFKAEVEANQNVWDEDGNTSLMTEVVGAYQEWQIMNLQRIYQEIPLSRVRRVTLSARTGAQSESDEEIKVLVERMITSGMLKGEVSTGEDGAAYLKFHDETTTMTETEFAYEIARTQLVIKELSTQYSLTNERLSESREYAKYLIREQKRIDKETPDAAIGFDEQVEDEDLMTGILSHA